MVSVVPYFSSDRDVNLIRVGETRSLDAKSVTLHVNDKSPILKDSSQMPGGGNESSERAKRGVVNRRD